MLNALFLALALTAPAEAQQWAPGETIPDAAALQLTPEGLSAGADNLDVLLPSQIAVPPTSDSGGGGLLGCVTEYSYAINNMWVTPTVTGADLVPTDAGTIELQIDLDVVINDATDPFVLDFDIVCVSGQCPGYVTTFPVTISAPVTLSVVDDGTGTGETMLAVDIGTLDFDNGLAGEDIELSGDCNGVDTVEDLLNQVGLSFYDIIIGAVNPILESQIQSQVEDLEQTLADALSAASVDQTLDVQGTTLNIRLYPGSTWTDADGVEIVMSGYMEAEQPTSCTDVHDPGGSARSDSPVPLITSLQPNTQAALLASDDFPDQGLYAIWRGGLLCFELGEGAAGSVDLGVPINTALLGILGGDPFEELFPETGPLLLRTDPRSPPTVAYDGTSDLTVQVRDLDLNFYADLDYRKARPLGITVTADAGVDVLFDDTTGEVAIDLALGPDEVRPEATMIEVAPAAKQEVEENFVGLLDTILDSLLGDALSGLAFGLPAMDGFGLTSLALGPSAADADWLEADAAVGQVSYPAGSCEEGCSGGGSTGGCMTPAGVAPWLLMGVVPLIRRRRR